MAQDLIRATGMAKSSFYYRQHSIDASVRYGVEKSKIQEIYHQHKGRYGYRRICLVLKQMGYGLNHKTVQKLMEELKLKSTVRVKKHRIRCSLGGCVQSLSNNLQSSITVET